jgi:hypothetical protein
MGQPRFYTLPPACVFVFCLHRHSLPPARVLCFIRRTSSSAYSKHRAQTCWATALRALTGPAPPSKDASVSNELWGFFGPRASFAVAPAPAPCAMHDTRRPRSRSRVLGLRLLLCPVFCLINN